MLSHDELLEATIPLGMHTEMIFLHQFDTEIDFSNKVRYICNLFSKCSTSFFDELKKNIYFSKIIFICSIESQVHMQFVFYINLYLYANL